MAIIAFDGFDHYNNNNDLANRQGQLQWTVTNSCSINTPGRGGFGKAVQLPGSGFGLIGTFASAFSTFFCGFAAELVSSFAASPLVIQFVDTTVNRGSGSTNTDQNGTAQFCVALVPTTGQVIVYGGPTESSTLLGQSGRNAFSPYVYNFFEIKGVINGSSGAVQINVNSEAVLTLSGLNTNPSGGGTVSAVQFSASQVASGSQPAYIDDFRMLDSTVGPGTYPCNTFVGDLRVATLFPTSNDSVTWTPLANANWQEVSETSMDGDSSYNYTTTAGNQDSFHMGSLPSADNVIYAVQVTGAYRKDDASVRTLKQVLLSSTTTGVGATQSIPTGYVYLTDLFVLDPATSASWTTAGVNAARAGYNMVS